MMRFSKWIFVFFFPFFAWAIAGANTGSMLLVNDSPFILTAVIQAADGTYLGEISVQPGQQKNFTQNLSTTQFRHPGKPEVSLTPFTVVWQCGSEGFYSMCTQVSPGSLVRANDCPGNHFCNPKSDKNKEGPASTLKKTK